MLGLTFKPHTDDLRDAPAIDIAAGSSPTAPGSGCTTRSAWTDAAGNTRTWRASSASTSAKSSTAADAVVLATEWPQYLQLEWGKYAGLTRNPLVLDGRHALDPKRIREAGFRYLSTTE